MSVNDSEGSAAGIPEIWHGALLRSLRTPLVFEGLTTREYEGDITDAGDTVRILTTSDVSIGNYSRGTALTADDLVLTPQKLVIDQQKEFAFEVNRLDVKQAKPEFVAEQSSRAAYGLKKTRDSFIASTMKSGVADNNILNSGNAYSVGTGPGDADAFEILAQLATVLDENDTPEAGSSPSMEADGGPDGGFRFVAVPPFFAEMLVLDPRKSSFGTTDNLRTYGERYIGRSVAGLEIFKSNQCPTGDAGGSARDVIAGWSKATAFAGQLTEFKDQDKQLDFARYYLGLDVYGAKVIRPSNLARAQVQRAS